MRAARLRIFRRAGFNMTLVSKLIQRTGAQVFCGFAERFRMVRALLLCSSQLMRQFTVPIFRNLWQGSTVRLSLWSIGPCLSISGNINAFDDVQITPNFTGHKTPLKMLRCQQVSLRLR